MLPNVGGLCLPIQLPDSVCNTALMGISDRMKQQHVGRPASLAPMPILQPIVVCLSARIARTCINLITGLVLLHAHQAILPIGISVDVFRFVTQLPECTHTPSITLALWNALIPIEALTPTIHASSHALPYTSTIRPAMSAQDALWNV